MNVRTVAIAAVLILVGASVLAVALAIQPQAQAHEDGTIHIHPTPTPTPPPPLGLNGPLSLDTSVVYDDAERQLVIIATINNPPPEDWKYTNSSINVDASHQLWSLNSHVRGSGEHSTVYYGADAKNVIVFSTDHFVAEVPLPDYVDFNRLTEPVLAKVEVWLQYRDIATDKHIQLNETLYFDLNDRDNWSP